MEIEYINNERVKYPENIIDLMKLVRKSQLGDSYSSSLIALCILCKNKEVNYLQMVTLKTDLKFSNQKNYNSNIH